MSSAEGKLISLFFHTQLDAMRGLTEWRVCGGISGVSTQRLDALLLRNPLCDNPKDVRGSEADQDSLQAGMLIDKLLNSNHLCVFVSQTQCGYTVVVLYWPPAICGYSCKRYKYIVCMYFEEVISFCTHPTGGKQHIYAVGRWNCSPSSPRLLRDARASSLLPNPPKLQH